MSHDCHKDRSQEEQRKDLPEVIHIAFTIVASCEVWSSAHPSTIPHMKISMSLPMSSDMPARMANRATPTRDTNVVVVMLCPCCAAAISHRFRGRGRGRFSAAEYHTLKFA